MRNEPLIFFHLKLVGKISLAAGVTAVLCLLVALSVLTGPSGESYESIIRNSSITRAQIGPLMLFSGLVLVALVGIVTWLIALYSSFRVAGPLYRFSRNFMAATSGGNSALLDLRRGDSLKRQEVHITQAVASLRGHYGAIDQAAMQASAALEQGDAVSYAEAVERLRILGEKARA